MRYIWWVVKCADLFVLSFSVAGTVGAIVTCPLEVVKTRLQSSRSGFTEIPQIARENGGTDAKTTCRTLPVGAIKQQQQQRRRLWTSSHHFRPQVVALSGYVAPPSRSIGLVQCLKHIVKHEGPLALFKGKLWDEWRRWWRWYGRLIVRA